LHGSSALVLSYLINSIEPSRIAWKAAALVTAFALFGQTFAQADRTGVSADTISGDYSATEFSRNVGAGGGHERQATRAANFSWLHRRALPWRDWYVGGGLAADSYAFSGGGFLTPRRLNDAAGIISLEYFVQDEPAVSISLRPGFYFERHLTRDSWDIPVEAIGGIPLVGSLSGALGVLDGRFYRHPIPVVGLIWIINAKVRLEAVFPEPSLVFKVSPRLETSLVGELGGGGFRRDSLGGHQTVEYTSYRVAWSTFYRFTPQVKLSVSAGYETERTFDFLEQNLQVRSQGAPYLKLGWEFTR
jgi:hypothetical protein